MFLLTADMYFVAPKPTILQVIYPETAAVAVGDYSHRQTAYRYMHCWL